jgi:hypothetical protein
MNENLNSPDQEKLKVWIKTQLSTAVRKLTDQGNVESLLIEAKPAWALPYQILIGKIREQGESNRFQWFICGEVPTDFLESAVATTPRDAARHFAMKWQLQAARYQEIVNQDLARPTPKFYRNELGGQLADMAEALYALVNDERLWLHKGSF